MQLALFPGSLHTNRWETLVALPTPYDSQIINMVVDTNWKVTARIKLPWHEHCFSTYVCIWLTQTVNKKIYTASLPYVNVWKYNWAIHSLIPCCLKTRLQLYFTMHAQLCKKFLPPFYTYPCRWMSSADTEYLKHFFPKYTKEHSYLLVLLAQIYISQARRQGGFKGVRSNPSKRFYIHRLTVSYRLKVVH